MDGRLRAGAQIALAVLLLAGCRDRHTAPPPPAARKSPPTSGSVNPDPGVTAYACADGQRVVAGYPDSATAIVTYRDHAYTLKRAPSANGSRYTGYGLEWRTDGAHAGIATLKPGEEAATSAGIDCTAVGPPPEAAVSHTAYSPGAR